MVPTHVGRVKGTAGAEPQHAAPHTLEPLSVWKKIACKHRAARLHALHWEDGMTKHCGDGSETFSHTKQDHFYTQPQTPLYKYGYKATSVL